MSEKRREDIFRDLLELFNIWKRERETKELSKLNLEALSKLEKKRARLLIELQKKENTLEGRILKSLYEKFSFMLEDLWKLRAIKIFRKTMMGEDLENVVKKERKFIKVLKELIDELISEEKIESLNFPECLLIDATEINIPQDTTERVLVVFKKEVPAFVDFDGRVYRGISKGIIASLHKMNFKLFRRELIEFIEPEI